MSVCLPPRPRSLHTVLTVALWPWQCGRQKPHSMVGQRGVAQDQQSGRRPDERGRPRFDVQVGVQEHVGN